MAITPRSFVVNPALLFVASLAILASGAFIFAGAGQSAHKRLSYWESVRDACGPDTDPDHWSERDWEAHVFCFVDKREYTAAYAAAAEALQHHPRSESLLNLRGFAAGRNGDHSVAAYDFNEGLRITGSPSGVFENNIAWTTLWQLDGLEVERAARVLEQSRGLYERSLNKAWSCERVHTGLFVEYAIADHHARSTSTGRSDARVREAVDRYVELYRQYQPCWGRIVNGDDLVIEEVLSAAVIDQEMGYIAGIRRPTRHLAWFDTAIEAAAFDGTVVDEAYCEAVIPVRSAVPACKALLR